MPGVELRHVPGVELRRVGELRGLEAGLVVHGLAVEQAAGPGLAAALRSTSSTCSGQESPRR